LIAWILFAVNSPDSVTNSIILVCTKPDEKSVCAAANVAWPQSLTCIRVTQIMLSMVPPKHFVEFEKTDLSNRSKPSEAKTGIGGGIERVKRVIIRVNNPG